MTFSGSVEDACRLLYAQDPATFVQRRTQLAADAVDPTLRSAITALRKPTQPAWIVNAQVSADPSVTSTLDELRAQLQQAHQDLDNSAMRDLSLRRRRLVAELTGAALRTCAKSDASQSVKDEVSATFDAAVADPEIAARLGMLQQPEHWSGFGVAMTGSPGLTLVPTAPKTRQDRRGKETKAPRAGATEKEARVEKPSVPAVDERARRKLQEAQEAFDAAETEWTEARQSEDDLNQRIRRLTTKISTLQHDLEQARRELDTARATARKNRQARRVALSTLDRAQRAVDSKSG